MTSLTGERVAITGRMASMSREEAIQLIRQENGSYAGRVDRQTTLVVIGASGWPLQSNGRLTKALLEARRLQRHGGQLAIEGESRFLRRLNGDVDEPVLYRYTGAELADMLGISAARLNHWRSLGLIRPSELRGQVAWFDFAEVRRCEMLFDAVSAGVPLRRILHSLQQVRRWAPETSELLDRLSTDGRRLLVRDARDRWREPQGQLCFVFEDDEQKMLPGEGEMLFQRAVDCETEGRFGEAVQLYRRFLETEQEDPDVWFNLGNSLAEVGDTYGALHAYDQAVRLDASFVEAWTNMGVMLADLGQADSSTNAFRQALELAPDNAEAMYGLAQVLEETGRRGEAQVYWREYLRYDCEGACAELARERLAPA